MPPKKVKFFPKNLNLNNFYFHSMAHFGVFEGVRPQKFRCAAKKGGVNSVLKISKCPQVTQKVQFPLQCGQNVKLSKTVLELDNLMDLLKFLLSFDRLGHAFLYKFSSKGVFFQ